jgi:hypothetical protein
MTNEPVHTRGRWRPTIPAAEVTRRLLLGVAALAVAALAMPSPGHAAAASEVECLADLWTSQ